MKGVQDQTHPPIQFLPPLIDFTHVRPVLTLDNIDPKSYSRDTWIQLVPRPNWLRNVSDDVGGAVTVPCGLTFLNPL